MDMVSRSVGAAQEACGVTRRRSLVQIRRRQRRGDDGQKGRRRGAMVEIYSCAQWRTIVGAPALSVTRSSWSPAELALQRLGVRPAWHGA